MRRSLDVLRKTARVHVALAAQRTRDRQRIVGRGVGYGLPVPQRGRPKFSERTLIEAAQVKAARVIHLQILADSGGNWEVVASLTQPAPPGRAAEPCRA